MKEHRTEAVLFYITLVIASKISLSLYAPLLCLLFTFGLYHCVWNMTLNIKSYFKHHCRTHKRYRLSPNVPYIAYVNIKLRKDLKLYRERERERECVSE